MMTQGHGPHGDGGGGGGTYSSEHVESHGCHRTGGVLLPAAAAHHSQS